MSTYEVTVWVEQYDSDDDTSERIEVLVRDALKHHADLYPSGIIVTKMEEASNA